MKSLTNAIRFMAAGERYFPLELIQENKATQKAFVSPLSDREVSVLNLLADGMPNREIGENLGLAEATVKMHVKSICRKLGVTNRTQAVIQARNLKLA
ncbi:response regulator transcription factor [Gemmobacter sp. 24YEA27]|nr:response regulator transcription factor [Gemmobacter sp. 24YEA27]